MSQSLLVIANSPPCNQSSSFPRIDDLDFYTFDPDCSGLRRGCGASKAARKRLVNIRLRRCQSQIGGRTASSVIESTILGRLRVLGQRIMHARRMLNSSGIFHYTHSTFHPLLLGLHLHLGKLLANCGLHSLSMLFSRPNISMEGS